MDRSTSNAPRRHVSFWGAVRRALLGLAVGSSAVVGVASCSNVEASPLPPSPRGITVPQPPPSFAELEQVTVDIDGDAESMEGFVLLYESFSDYGRFTYPEADGGFLFTEVIVPLPNNCLQLSQVDGDGVVGATRSSRLEVLDGEACGSGLCSEADTLGTCVCLVPQPGGC